MRHIVLIFGLIALPSLIRGEPILLFDLDIHSKYTPPPRGYLAYRTESEISIADRSILHA